jgi:predicted MPP superfamily phosphohydrolase
MRFIHISDMHFSPSNAADIELVRDSLIKDIQAFRATTPVDFIFFTGDLVDRGDDPDSFLGAIEEIINPLMAAAGVDRQNFILCPGNHDVSQKAFKGLHYLDAGLTASLQTLTATNKFIDSQNDEWFSHSLRPMGQYEDFEELHYGTKPIGPSRLVKIFDRLIGDRKISICAFNSAWRSQAGTGNDKERLIIGERTIDAAIQASENADLRIALMHHPLDWLTSFDRNAVEPRLYQSFDFMLFGHLHAQRPELGLNTLGRIVKLQAGAIFSGRDAACTYSITDIDFETGKILIHLRTWSDYARTFVADLQLAPPAGVMPLSLPKPQRDAGELQLKAILRLLRAHIRAQANEQVTLLRPKSEGTDDIRDVFTCPPLLTTKYLEASEGLADKATTVVEVLDLLNQSNHQIIIGKHESGKTSLGHLLAVNISEGIGDRLRLPAIIDFSELKRYPNSLVASVRDYLMPLDPNFPGHADIEPMFIGLKAHPFLLIIDNVNLEDKDKFECIEYLMAARPNDRWILLADDDSGSAIVGAKSQGAVAASALHGKYERIHLQDLPRHAIREISRRRNELGDVELARVFPRVMRQLDRAGLPRNGYMVSVLAWHAAQDKGTEELNEASLIKEVIEHLLDRGQTPVARRELSDSKVKEILLSELAWLLCKYPEGVTLNEGISVIAEYFAQKKWDYAADLALRSLINSRILEVRAKFLEFRLDCFADYFVAKHLADNPIKLAEVINQNAYIKYLRPLDLMTSLTRQDHGLLKSIQQLMETLEHGGANNGKYGRFTDQKLLMEVYAPSLKELKEHRLTARQVDDMVDNLETHMSMEFKEGLPGSIDDAGSSVNFGYFMTIQLYGRIVRNAETLSGNTKIAALRFYLERAGRIVGETTGRIKLAKDITKYFVERNDLKLSEDELSALIAYIQTSVPVSFANAIYSDIFSSRLLGTIKALLASDDLPDDEHVLLGLAALKMDFGFGLDVFRAVFDRLRSQGASASRFVLLVYHLLLSGIFQAQDYDAKWEHDLENCLADLEIGLGQDRRVRSAILDDLRKKRIRLRTANSNKAAP